MINTIEIQKIMRLHKILHANRMSNLEEIDKFVEIYKI